MIFLVFRGARDTYSEVKDFYLGLGAIENVGMVEDDDEHASTKSNREAMYAFFQKYLDNPGSSEDLDVEIFEEQELWVTETGKVATSFKSETLFTLNKKKVQQQLSELNIARSQRSDMTELKSNVEKISGFKYPEHLEPGVFFRPDQARGVPT